MKWFMQMAWLSREEEALDRIREHLEESNHNVRMEFLEAVTRAVFPRLGVIGAQTRWITRGDVTRITLWGRQHVLNNLRVAIIREAMGLGPKHYCIMTSWDPSFESKLLLLMRYLPEEKMSFYSGGDLCEDHSESPAGRPVERRFALVPFRIVSFHPAVLAAIPGGVMEETASP